jgi:hypothetical protein
MPLEVMRRLAGDRASDTLRRRRILHGGIGRLLDDGLRDLGVRVTALVQRAACECSDACRCCQLPANALCAASIYCGSGALPEYTEAPEEYALVLVCPLPMSRYKAAYPYRMYIGFSRFLVEGHQNII